MEVRNEEIVIVGAGISGLATAVALHRLGHTSLVLESSDELRATGVAFTTFTNAWRALDALGIAQSLRRHHPQLFGIYSSSTVSGHLTSHVSFNSQGTHGHHEVRCVKRKALLEALAKELPSGSIRYSSKLVSIQESQSGLSKLLHLSDGSILKTNVLLGCDGVNSVVSKWLGFNKPVLCGRWAIRGCAYYKQGHGFEPMFQQLMGHGVRYGIVPSDDTAVYWFLTCSPSSQEKDILKEGDQVKLKELVMRKLGKAPEHIRAVIQDTGLEEIVCSPLGLRSPWEILSGNISKDNVSIAGDAFHPMTPDLGQGGCSALEDGVILGRCLAQALHCPTDPTNYNDHSKMKRITEGLNKYAKERRWRAFDLVTTAYLLGFIQETNWIGLRSLRDTPFFSTFLSGLFLRKADVDPNQLHLLFQ